MFVFFISQTVDCAWPSLLVQNGLLQYVLLPGQLAIFQMIGTEVYIYRFTKGRV